MPWSIQILPSAVADLDFFPASAQRIIEGAVDRHLLHAPLAISRNLKLLQPNPIASYELRIHGQYRVWYRGDDVSQVVTIVVIGRKQGNALYVQGKEYRLHHEDHSTN